MRDCFHCTLMSCINMAACIIHLALLLISKHLICSLQLLKLLLQHRLLLCWKAPMAVRMQMLDLSSVRLLYCVANLRNSEALCI